MNIEKLSIVGGILLVIALALWFAVDAASIDALRIWSVVCTILLPVTGYAAWWARGTLSSAEHAGLQTGMTHTLDVVRAVRPSREVQRETRREIVAPFGRMPQIPDPGFEIVSGSGNVVDL
ncbi:MAG: hypothetical protein JXR84_15265 [Anaerolineae bacterium]|nr:hypothetical protein [Anaerolineae bacterium]